MALVDRSPGDLFNRFIGNINEVLHQTICDTRLILYAPSGFGPRPMAEMIFARQSGTALDARPAAPLRNSPWFFFLAQLLEAVPRRQESGWRLRTLKYRYCVQTGPRLRDPCLVRFEYESRDLREKLHPRHHLHVEASVNLPGVTIPLQSFHIPTGWVTIEELIRFLISELNVKSRDDRWDQILRKSEELFREWTGRSV